jgi:creatinine amidohydrolase
MRMVILGSIVAVAAGSAGSMVARQAQPPRGIVLGHIAWPEAETVLRADTVVVLPVGAASKEHGPHLPLGNDLNMADYLTRRVADASAVVIAPTLTYHFYPAFVEYPGSTSLTAETSRALTVDVVRSLARFGPKRFYALNTGISTLRPLEAAAKTLAAEGILLTFTNLNTRLEPVASRLRQQEGGTHADEIETSMMLYIDPATVDMRRAVKDYAPSTGPPRLTRRRGAEGTYSPTGIWGDPTLATRAKGQLLVEALVAGILDDIEVLRKATPPPAQPVTPPSVPAAARDGQGGRGSSRGPRTCTPGDERDIRQIGDAYALHWSNADPRELGELWSPEGDMIHPDGLIERSRQTIVFNRTELFTRREYRGSRHPLSLTMIHCVSADVAVADGKWELRNLSDATGKPLPSFEGQATLVVTRAGGRWQIAAYRYTIKPSAVPRPTFLKRPGWPDKPGG